MTLDSETVYSATCVAGLTLGSLAIICTLFVFVWRSKLGADGISLSFVGCVLVSFSLWQSVNIKVAGAEMKLERVRQVIDTATPVINRAQQLSAKMEDLANDVDVNGKKPTTVRPEEVRMLAEQWKVITNTTANLSKDIDEMMARPRELR